MPSLALPVAAFLEMLIKSVVSRATTATRAGCIQHGLGDVTAGARCGSSDAAEDHLTYSTTQHTPAVHRGAHCKQDRRS